MVSTMDPWTIFIIGFAVFACLFFIYVIIWGIRGLSSKDDDNPVHIKDSSWQPIESRYASQYPTPQQAYSPYPAYPQSAVSWDPYDNYLDGYYNPYQQYPYPEVAWDDGHSYQEEYTVPPPRIVPKMPKEYSKPGSPEMNYNVDYSSVAPPKPPRPPAQYVGKFATEGMHDIVKLVENHGGITATGYPAFASSEQKALGPANMADQQFYNVRDYAYTAEDIMPAASVPGPDYAADEVKENLPVLEMVPSEGQGPRIEKRIRPIKQTLKESTKCNVCLGFIKTGLPLITCVCSKSFHVSCAYRMERCPICNQDLLSYDDIVVDESPEEITLKPLDDTMSPGELQPPMEDKQPDMDSPIHRTMSSLTDQQKERLKSLLSKYETGRVYKPLATSDILSD